MSFLPSSNFASMASGSILEQFNYFARPITIYKQPVETIVNNPSNLLYGYDNVSQTTNSQISLTEEYRTFSGLMIYPFKNKGSSNGMFDNKIVLEDNKTYIKILPETFSYINNGTKTQKIVVDGLTWNIGSKIQPANFFGLLFYYQELIATN